MPLILFGSGQSPLHSFLESNNIPMLMKPFLFVVGALLLVLPPPVHAKPVDPTPAPTPSPQCPYCSVGLIGCNPNNPDCFCNTGVNGGDLCSDYPYSTFAGCSSDSSCTQPGERCIEASACIGNFCALTCGATRPTCGDFCTYPDGIPCGPSTENCFCDFTVSGQSFCNTWDFSNRNPCTSDNQCPQNERCIQASACGGSFCSFDCNAITSVDATIDRKPPSRTQPYRSKLDTGNRRGLRRLGFNANTAPGLESGRGTAGPCSRLTNGAIVLEQGDANYVKYSTMCADYDYEGWLVIEKSHFYVVGSPHEDAVMAGCPHVGSHAVFLGPKVDASGGPYIKEVLIWDEHQDMESFLQDSFPLGTFKASEVIRAHEGIDPKKSKHSTYNVIDFSCVDFLMALAAALDVKIDSKITSFVTRRLIEDAGQTLANTIRESASYFSLFVKGRRLLTEEDSNFATDEEVIEALVDKRAADLSSF